MTKAPASMQPNVNMRDGEPPFILVADDDQDMREEVADVLQGEGYLVIDFDSGDRMLRYLRGCVLSEDEVRAPDVIVSDIRMPGMSGLEILRALRDMPCAIPVILMTAFGGPDIHQEARRHGATTALDKPFEAEVLRAAVLEALSGSVEHVHT